MKNLDERVSELRKLFETTVILVDSVAEQLRAEVVPPDYDSMIEAVGQLVYEFSTLAQDLQATNASSLPELRTSALRLNRSNLSRRFVAQVQGLDQDAIELTELLQARIAHLEENAEAGWAAAYALEQSIRSRESGVTPLEIAMLCQTIADGLGMSGTVAIRLALALQSGRIVWLRSGCEVSAVGESDQPDALIVAEAPEKPAPSTAPDEPPTHRHPAKSGAISQERSDIAIGSPEIRDLSFRDVSFGRSVRSLLDERFGIPRTSPSAFSGFGFPSAIRKQGSVDAPPRAPKDPNDEPPTASVTENELGQDSAVTLSVPPAPPLSGKQEKTLDIRDTGSYEEASPAVEVPGEPGQKFFEPKISVDENEITASALRLLPYYPSAAYQMVSAFASLHGTGALLIPVWAFRLHALTPWCTVGSLFPNAQIRDDFAEAFTALSTTTHSYSTNALPMMLAACSIGPAIVAPETTASTLLRQLPLPEPLAELMKIIAALADQLGGVELFALAPHASPDSWNERRENIRRRAREWREEIDQRASSRLFIGARSVLRRWLRDETYLVPIVELLASSVLLPSSLERITELSREGKADIDRRIDAITSEENPTGDYIDGRARRVLLETAEAGMQLLREILSLARTRPEVGSASQRNIARTLPVFDEKYELSLVALRDQCSSPLREVAISSGLLRTAIVDLRNRLHGEHTSVPGSVLSTRPADVAEALGRDLLMVRLTLNEQWSPLEKSTDVLSELQTFVPPSSSRLREIFEDHITRFDFLGAERLLKRLEGDEEWASDLLSGIGKRVEEARRPLLVRVDSARRSVELAFRDSLLTELERESRQNILTRLTEAFKVNNFPESLSQLTEIEEDLAKRRDDESQKLLEILSQIPEVDSFAYASTRKAILDGQFTVANEYLRHIEFDGTIPVASKDLTDEFSRFFPGVVRSLTDALVGPTAIGDQVRKWVQEHDRTGRLGPLAPADRANEWRPILNAWFSRGTKPTLNEENVERLFKWLGFEDVAVDRDERESTDRRRVFRVATRPINKRDVIPLAAFGSERVGRYTVVCHINATSLNTESAGAPAIHLVQSVLDERRRRELATQAGSKGLKFVVLDDLLLLHLTTVKSERLRAFFEDALPFTGIQPYTGTASIVPPEIFYGREKEMAQVLDPNGTCLIYGGRQLGKTALLLQVVARHNRPQESQSVFWIDLKNQLHSDPNALFNRIFTELRALDVFPQGRRAYNDKSPDDIIAWLNTDDRRRIVFLLDEADDFLTLEQENGFKNVGSLKSLMERSRKRFKVVFAGLHNVVRFSKIPNHPLAHFGEPVNIGPLMGAEWNDALAIIEQPMGALGYRFDEEAALSILLQANYYPVLLQLWGRHLLEFCHGSAATRQAGPPYKIVREIVDNTYSSKKDLREQLREKFRFTLQLDERYMVIAYALRDIYDNSSDGMPLGVPLDQLFNLVVSVWRDGFGDMPHADFRAYLDEMEGLGVLRTIKSDRYAFRNPTVPLLMGSNEDVISVLLQDRKLDSHDPNQFRKMVDRDASPLTSLQLKELYGLTSGPVIIVGSEALGLGQVTEFLRREEATTVVVADHCGDKGAYIRLNKETALSDDTVLFISSAESAWNATWIEWAIGRAAKTGNGRRRRWVFLVGPARASKMDEDLERLEQRGVTVIRLERLRGGALAAWISVNGIPLPAEKSETLARLTGNIPWLLNKFKERAIGDGTASQALIDFARAQEAREYRIGYESAVGLNDVDPALRSVLLQLAAYGEPCTLDELTELLRDENAAELSPSLRAVDHALRWGQRMTLVWRRGGRYQTRPDVSLTIG